MKPKPALLTIQNARAHIEANKIALLIDIIDNKSLYQPDIANRAFAQFITGHRPNPYFYEQAQLLKHAIVQIKNRLEQVDQKIAENKQSQRVLQANCNRLHAAIKRQHTRLKTAKQLWDNHAIAHSAYLDTLANYIDLKQQEVIKRRELDLKQAEQDSLKLEYKTTITTWDNQNWQRQADIVANLQTLHERWVTAKRKLTHMTLKSPVKGIVDKLQVFTIGAIVKSAEPLMQIVPEEDYPELEVFFSNAESGFLAVGQTANIKLNAFPSERFGYITGKVVSISADAIKINDTQWGFVARIRPDRPYLATPLAR